MTKLHTSIFIIGLTCVLNLFATKSNFIYWKHSRAHRETFTNKDFRILNSGNQHIILIFHSARKNAYYFAKLTLPQFELVTLKELSHSSDIKSFEVSDTERHFFFRGLVSRNKFKQYRIIKNNLKVEPLQNNVYIVSIEKTAYNLDFKVNKSLSSLDFQLNNQEVTSIPLHYHYKYSRV